MDACVVRMGAMCVCRMHWSVCAYADGANQLEKESGKGAISAQLALIASTLFWWAAALCEMTKCCVPAGASCSGLVHRQAGSHSRREPGRRQRDREYICCCHYAFPLLTLLISFSPPRFVSAVALAQYLPDPISLPLCFAPDVSTFSLNSTSASLFFPHCLFHLLITALTAFLGCLLNAVFFSRLFTLNIFFIHNFF